MLDPSQFLRYIIRPVLGRLELGGRSAEALTLGTDMYESKLQYIDQIEKGGDKAPGPAYGLGQMEKPTHDDIWENYLKWRSPLNALVRSFVIGAPSAIQMQGNLYYSVAMTRLQYARHAFPLPAENDYKAMAALYKKYYNTSSGAGSELEAENQFAHAVSIVQQTK